MLLIRKTVLMFTLLTSVVAPLSQAGAKAPVAGKDYQVLSPALNTDSGNKIEVTEFFWYGCPHCFHIEPDSQCLDQKTAQRRRHTPHSRRA